MYYKRILTTLLTGMLAVGSVMPVAAASQSYIAETKNESLVNDYLSTLSLSDVIGSKKLNQIPYTMLATAQTATVNVRLSLREGCSVSETRITILAPYTKVKILGAARDSKWVYVDTEQAGRGFVAKKYLTITGKDTSSDEDEYLVTLEDAELTKLKASGVSAEKTDDSDSMRMFELLLKQSGTHLEKVNFKKITAKKMYVSTQGQAQLRLRSGCSTSYEEIDVIPYGSEVTVSGYGVNEKWAYVTYNGKTGFVYAANLSDTKPAESATQTTSDDAGQASTDTTNTADTVTGDAAEASGSTASTETTTTVNTEYLGTFKLTFYCNCSICCGKWAGGSTASGTYPTAGRTIAVDPDVIPLGSQVVINGHTYTAEDTGSSIVGNRIDVYMDSHSAALDAGVQYADVYLVK